MLKVKSAIARAIRERLYWSWIGVALSLLIVAIAASTLSKSIHSIEFGRVASAIKDFPVERMLVAGGFVAGSYLALTFYDLFALRIIGRGDIFYRIAAFASFTSYTIGHNLGATVFTSGIVRFRIYSSWGVNLIDIAKIAFVTALTYWLGNAFVLGFGMSNAPAAASAFDELPAWMNRMIGLSALMAIAGYLAWLSPRPRVIGRSTWQLILPGPRATLVQISIGAMDLTCVALAMYTLLPGMPVIDFATFLVIFIASMLLGVMSYVPGSLGVLEAAMFIGLPQFQREELLASLLIFRLMNFVFPLGLAVSLFGLRECWIVAGGAVGNRDRDVWKSRRPQPHKSPAE